MSFEKAVSFTLRMEGGYVNHPADRGGETNFGVTKPALCRAFYEGIVKHMYIPRELTTFHGKIDHLSRRNRSLVTGK